MTVMIDNMTVMFETQSTVTDDTQSLAPDEYYGSHYESCSILNFPVLPIPEAVISKTYKKRKREKRKTKRRSKKESSCEQNSEITCAVDNLSVVMRGDKDDLDATENNIFANLSFLTCESKENVDHCTCVRNVDIMKDEVTYMNHSPSSTETDCSQNNSTNQSRSEVRN